MVSSNMSTSRHHGAPKRFVSRAASLSPMRAN